MEIINEKVRIGDAELRGATTATLDFAKDRRGDYILAGDEVIADAGDGIDTYEVLKVLPGNKVKIGGLGVEVATVDAKTVSIAHKHGILKRDGDTVVLKNAKWQINYFDGGYDFVDAPNHGEAKRKAADMEKKSGRGVRSVIVAENYPKPYKDFVIRSNSTNPVVANAIAWKARNTEQTIDQSVYPNLRKYGFIVPGKVRLQKNLTFDAGKLYEEGQKDNLIKLGKKMARERNKYISEFYGPVGIPKFYNLDEIPHDKLESMCIRFALGEVVDCIIDGKRFAFSTASWKEKEETPSSFPYGKVKEEYHKYIKAIEEKYGKNPSNWPR